MVEVARSSMYHPPCRQASFELCTVDVQRNGGDVAYIHIGNVEIHQLICEAITFGFTMEEEKKRKYMIQLKIWVCLKGNLQRKV